MDDLISRAAVKQAFNQYKKDKKVRTPFEANRIFDLSEIINGLPAVDAVPVRHGHWIYKRGCWAECSECHHDYKDAYDLENSDNYCRHCGALMDGETNG